MSLGLFWTLQSKFSSRFIGMTLQLSSGAKSVPADFFKKHQRAGQNLELAKPMKILRNSVSSMDAKSPLDHFRSLWSTLKYFDSLWSTLESSDALWSALERSTTLSFRRALAEATKVFFMFSNKY